MGRRGIQTRPRSVRVGAALGLAGLVLGCAACSASSTASTTTSTGATTTSTTTPTTTTVPAPSTTVPVTTATASGTAADSAGDAVQVQLTLGQAVPATTISKAAVTDCASGLESDNSSMARSAAFPVTLTTRLTSSSAVTVNVDLLLNMAAINEEEIAAGSYSTDPAGETIRGVSYGGDRFWATSYGNTGPECIAAAGGDDGQWADVSLKDMAPGSANTWSSYLVIPEAITPASVPLSNPQNPANTILFDPVVTIAGSQQTYLMFTSGQPNVFTCQGISSATTYMAVDPAAMTQLITARPGSGCSS